MNYFELICIFDTRRGCSLFLLYIDIKLSLAPFVEQTTLSLMNFLDTFVEIQLIVSVTIFFWNPNSILLKIYVDPMIVPHCFDSVVLQ